jgi:hypothetical protein
MELMKSIVILILLSILASCEPANNEIVITGSKNDDLEIVRLNPVISLPTYPINATDSIDLNGDNLFEAKFIKLPKPASGETTTFILQSFSCNSDNCPYIGNFVNVTDKFIGYKIGKTMGWIKIDNSVDGDLKIKEYTVIK